MYGRKKLRSGSTIDCSSPVKSDFGPEDFKEWAEKYGWDRYAEPVDKAFKHAKLVNKERVWARKKAGQVKQYHQKENPRVAAIATRLKIAAWARSRVLGVKSDITAEWILERLRVGVCERTGIPFDLHLEDGSETWHRMFAPSLDQIKPSGGYTKDNVQVVCWCYNAAKSTGTDADVLRMAEALVAKSKQGKHEG